MKTNIGPADRLLRLMAGALFCVFYFYGEGKDGWYPWWLIAAAVLVITAYTGFCPLYKLLGIDTCAANGERKHKHPTHPKQE